jgi:uncharacterized protein
MNRLLFVFLLMLVSMPSSAQDYFKGLNAFSRGDFETALAEWQPLANNGHPSAQTFLGDMYYDGKGVERDFVKAFTWYRRAAEKNYTLAQIKLGRMYDVGRGVLENDIEATKWFRRAAEKGDPVGQHHLGDMYRVGQGVKLDKREAVRWFQKAADQGSPESLLVLGWMNKSGEGIPQNLSIALKRYLELANRGDYRGQKIVGQIYENGDGVLQDFVLAHMWYNLAEASGGGQAKKYRERISLKMTSKQIAEAQRLARQWKPKVIAKSVPSVSADALRSNEAVPRSVSKSYSKGNARPDAVAVIIGNKTYDGSIPDVSFAHNDADAFHKFVVDGLGYRDGNVIDLRDATFNQMVTVFGNDKTHEGKLFDYIRPGESDVTVFYSGHGVPGLKDKQAYLLPSNGDPNRAEISGYPLAILYKNLNKLPARTIQVFIDACFSGETPKGMLVRSASGISVTPKPPLGSSRMVVLTAAQGNQLRAGMKKRSTACSQSTCWRRCTVWLTARNTVTVTARLHWLKLGGT